MSTLVVPHPTPSPYEDAEKIRNAVQGFGTDEKAIISILAHRNAIQRREIRMAYEELYNEDLIKRLESELSGDFEEAVYRWIYDPAERDAILAHVALKNLKHNFNVLIEIACELSPNELVAVKHAYQSRYKCSLEEDVASHSVGSLRKVLVSLISAYKYDGNKVNIMLASLEANILHNAIEMKDLSHEDVIIILSTRSKAQLNATFNHYKEAHGVSITKNILEKSTDELSRALYTTIQCINHSTKYFAKVIHNAINKIGTDEDALTRVVVRHAERNLKQIKDLYYKKNNTDLDIAVANDTSGDYKAFLLALLGSEGY